MTESTTTESTTTEHAMPEKGTLPDHRADVTAAQEWVAGLIAGVRDDQWSEATPCSDFDVAALVRHLFGVADRLIAMGAGRPAASEPHAIAELPDDVVGSYAERVERGRLAWADPASLVRVIEAPWGPTPGAIVLSAYVAENLTHGWDLAVATGQDPEADPGLAAPAYATMQRALPAEGREPFPFDPPVEPAADAGPTERLANWSGRVSR